jgi:hypothetical protein
MSAGIGDGRQTEGGESTISQQASEQYTYTPVDPIGTFNQALSEPRLSQGPSIPYSRPPEEFTTIQPKSPYISPAEPITPFLSETQFPLPEVSPLSQTASIPEPNLAADTNTEGETIAPPASLEAHLVGSEPPIQTPVEPEVNPSTEAQDVVDRLRSAYVKEEQPSPIDQEFKTTRDVLDKLREGTPISPEPERLSQLEERIEALEAEMTKVQTSLAAALLANVDKQYEDAHPKDIVPNTNNPEGLNSDQQYQNLSENFLHS